MGAAKMRGRAHATDMHATTHAAEMRPPAAMHPASHATAVHPATAAHAAASERR